MTVDEHTIEVAGASVFYRHAPGGDVTPLYLHSTPTSSDDWLDFIARTGGLAPDLPGFGRSSKAESLVYTLPAYADFVDAFLAELETDTVTLVGHGWGAAAGLVFAQRHPHRVQRLVLIDAVPLLDGFKWPPLVSRLRLPVVGELLMGSTNRRVLGRVLRRAAATADAWSDERLELVWQQFDQGTQRAILRLHRSIDPAGLASAGEDLGELWMPALVLWGERDPWLPWSYADSYAQRLPRAQREQIAGAGHWPWLDRPAVIERVTAFVSEHQ